MRRDDEWLTVLGQITNQAIGWTRDAEPTLFGRAQVDENGKQIGLLARPTMKRQQGRATVADAVSLPVPLSCEHWSDRRAGWCVDAIRFGQEVWVAAAARREMVEAEFDTSGPLYLSPTFVSNPETDEITGDGFTTERHRRRAIFTEVALTTTPASKGLAPVAMFTGRPITLGVPAPVEVMFERSRQTLRRVALDHGRKPDSLLAWLDGEPRRPRRNPNDPRARAVPTSGGTLIHSVGGRVLGTVAGGDDAA
jgi:hypothetical protein